MAAPTTLHLARRAVRPSLPACRAAVRRPSPAAFTLSARAAEKEAGARTDRYPDDDHMLRKRDALDVQGANAKAGLEAHNRPDGDKVGGHATERRDTAGAIAKAKAEHPEAPDPAIGMQDERGRKGA